MTTAKVLLKLATLALGLAVCLPGLAETPGQVQQRLEDLRRIDAEAARRRQETVEFQERRRREEYARRWRCYGNEEVDVLLWRQQRDGTWVTVSKPASGFTDCPGSGNFPAVVRYGDTIVKIAQRYGLTLRELIQLNPDLETARLVVGSQVRLTESAPGCSQGTCGLRSLEVPGQADTLVGVSCTALMVNRKPPYKPWGGWQRPGRGTTDEQLVIDRCAAPNRLSMP